MYVTRSNRQVGTFYLDMQNDRERFQELLNDPSINIIEKVYQKQSESTFDGDSQTVIERPTVRVEWDECSL